MHPTHPTHLVTGEVPRTSPLTTLAGRIVTLPATRGTVRARVAEAEAAGIEPTVLPAPVASIAALIVRQRTALL